MSVIVPVVGIGIATLGGVGWYVASILTASQEIDDPLRSIAAFEVQKDLQEDDLIDIGTGQQAEEKLGSELSNSRDIVLISGAVNTTVFSLIRNYLPSRVVLQVLANPKFSKPMYLSRIASTYSGKIRSTEKILSDDITVFFIDNKQTLLLRNKDNGVLIAKNEESAISLAKKSADMWYESKPLEL